MPLPFAHTLMAYTAYDATPKIESGSWGLLAGMVVLSNLPDLDFLPGLLEGNANKYHHAGWSHSLGAAIMVGGLAAAFMKFRGGSFPFFFILMGGIYFSHIVLDYFSHDTSVPYGVPILWPFTGDYYISPQPIFMSVHKVGDSKVFFQNLFVAHNLLAALWEIVVFMPVMVLVKLYKKRKSRFHHEPN